MQINGDGPIPGENYTSDTKNYPWHQPPEHASVPEALDMLSVKLTEPKTARGLVAMAEAGFPLVNISQMIIMEGVAQGKWTIDMGLLIAGPVTKIIEIMCNIHNVEPDIGIAEDEEFHTGAFFKGEVEAKKRAASKGEMFKTVAEELPKIESVAEEQSNNPPAEDGSGGDEGLAQQGFAKSMGAKPQGAK